MTAEEFQNSEENRNALALILRNPVLHLAFAVLKEDLEPVSGNGAVANPVIGASRFQQLAGANHIIGGLAGLTKPYKPPQHLQGKRQLPTELPPQ